MLEYSCATVISLIRYLTWRKTARRWFLSLHSVKSISPVAIMSQNQQEAIVLDIQFIYICYYESCPFTLLLSLPSSVLLILEWQSSRLLIWHRKVIRVIWVSTIWLWDVWVELTVIARVKYSISHANMVGNSKFVVSTHHTAEYILAVIS